MKLQEKYLKLQSEYISAFEKHTDIEFEHESGKMFFFGDFFFCFDDIRDVVDN